ncbi:myc box-dependent-interacting protein 1-like isoform X6, partial [Biomphalaria pfeifferi]
MAEANTNSKIGILAKAQKQLSRTKTKVLQNLGKAEKTTDDVFKDYVVKTERQQEVAQHLQKELKTYAHCVKDLSFACKNLQQAFAETYESEWTGEPKFKSQIQAFELLWNDYLQNLQDNVINPMNAYLLSFPVLKNKISKRGRKMVDYDNSRHNLEVLQSAKKRDETKIQKAQDELKDVKRIFDELNNELHNELPDFYNSRVTFYAELYSKFFGAENTLHSEVGKTCESITDIAQSLGKDFEHFKYQPKRPISVT